MSSKLDTLIQAMALTGDYEKIARLFWTFAIRTATNQSAAAPRLEFPIIPGVTKDKPKLTVGDWNALQHILAGKIGEIEDIKSAYSSSRKSFSNDEFKPYRNRISRLEQQRARLEEIQVKVKHLARQPS